MRQAENGCDSACVTDVEALANRFVALDATHDAIDKVIDVAPSTDLIAIAINLDFFIGEGAFDENLDRSFPCLTWSVNIERTHGDNGQLVLAMIGVS